MTGRKKEEQKMLKVMMEGEQLWNTQRVCHA